MLINNIEIIINKIGTNISLLIKLILNSLNSKINGNKTSIPPAGEGMPSKKLSFQDGSASELTLNLANLKATYYIC